MPRPARRVRTSGPARARRARTVEPLSACHPGMGTASISYGDIVRSPMTSPGRRGSGTGGSILRSSSPRSRIRCAGTVRPRPIRRSSRLRCRPGSGSRPANLSRFARRSASRASFLPGADDTGPGEDRRGWSHRPRTAPETGTPHHRRSRGGSGGGRVEGRDGGAFRPPLPDSGSPVAGDRTARLRLRDQCVVHAQPPSGLAPPPAGADVTFLPVIHAVDAAGTTRTPP